MINKYKLTDEKQKEYNSSKTVTFKIEESYK